jgi:hypothetical protein
VRPGLASSPRQTPKRRRVGRNLHDGAQQRMLNLMLALRLAKIRLSAEAYDELGMR